MSAVAAVAAVIGWIGAVVTGSGWWSVALLLLTIATTVFAVAWVTAPGSLRWWSGLVVLVVAIGPACYAYVTLEGSLAHVAGLLTLVAAALAGMTVVRRYEMPPVGR
jgi:hypothetical protein